MIHIVKQGESLYSIAQKYKTTIKQLMELNNLQNTVLMVGQQLLISTQEMTNTKKQLTYNEFIESHSGTGMLKIQVLIGNTYFPIKDVKVEIFKEFKDGRKKFYQGYTEESGLIDPILLPTPPKKEDYSNGYSIYQIEATHPNYKSELIEEVYLYDGIKSIQKIEMIPISYHLGKEKNYV